MNPLFRKWLLQAHVIIEATAFIESFLDNCMSRLTRSNIAFQKSMAFSILPFEFGLSAGTGLITVAFSSPYRWKSSLKWPLAGS